MSKSQYVTGLRAVEELLAGGKTEVRRLFAEYKSANPRVAAVIRMAKEAGVEVQPANRARLEQISGESRHQGIVAEIRRSSVMDEAALRSRVEEALEAGENPLLLVLDGVQDPHNLGACMRTADAAGALAVVVPRRGAAGLSPIVSKVAAGAAEHLPFVPVTNLGKALDWIGEYGFLRVATSDAADSDLYDVDLTGPVALIMGREHTGVGKGVAKRCDALVSLPMHGVVSSLNVSVATGICLYEILRQRGAGQEQSS